MRTAIAWALVAALASVGCDEGGGREDAGALPSADAGAFVPSTRPRIPAVTGTCPDLSATGVVTFSPEGIPPRDVQIYVSERAASLDGPLVFYWHGTGNQPDEAELGMSGGLMDWVLEAGGLVAAPFHDPASGEYPWFLTTGSTTDDLLLADEILACAVEGIGVDVMRVHSMGASAGALHTTQMMFRRASYLASVAFYSGGLYVARTPPTDDPNNRLAALIFHGGPTDQFIIRFENASEQLWTRLDAREQTGILCDHGQGHTIPTDVQPDVRRFLEAHPFGAYPSPWAEQLPADFYGGCALTP